jgi:hypothetical protein
MSLARELEIVRRVRRLNPAGAALAETNRPSPPFGGGIRLPAPNRPLPFARRAIYFTLRFLLILSLLQCPWLSILWAAREAFRAGCTAAACGMMGCFGPLVRHAAVGAGRGSGT